MEPLEHDDPRTLGGHRILARLGAGATAVVYLGRSRGGRLVAVKAVHAERARRPEARDHFVREVAATAAAGGVHSPPVVAADPGGRVPWMATEFLPSVSLLEAVERFGPLPGHSVRRLAAGLAEALAAVHRAGIVHRDVKPANVLLTADGPKLIDFGIAAAARPAELAGTPGFMSPEQVAGAETGPASDVHSLGSTLAYACGDHEAYEALHPHAGTAPGAPPLPETDDALRALIADCRRPDPAERPTPAALGERLARELAAESGPDAPPPHTAAWLPAPVMAAIDAHASEAANPPLAAAGSPRRRLLLGGAAAVAAGLAATVLLALRHDEPQSGPRGDARPDAKSPPSSASPSPEPEPEPEPVAVEIVLRGDGPVEALTYAVNRRPETLKNVALPWRKTVEVPRETGSAAWSIDLSHYGEVTYEIHVDGRKVMSRRSPDPGIPASVLGRGPYGAEAGGEVAFGTPSRGTSA